MPSEKAHLASRIAIARLLCRAAWRVLFGRYERPRLTLKRGSREWVRDGWVCREYTGINDRILLSWDDRDFAPKL